MRNLKRTLSLSLAVVMLLGTTTAFAAKGDVTDLEGNILYENNDILLSKGIRNEILLNYRNLGVELESGNIYKWEDVIASYNEHGEDYENHMDEYTPIKEIDESEELEVIEISAINKTSVVVLLNKNAEEVLTPGFFNVTGATVTSVEQGVTPNVWVLTVNSLDGIAGTVAVNGVSKAFDFEAPVTAKAKVESVKFNNYRQFQVTYSEVVDEATAKDPRNYYFEIVEGDAEPNKLSADLGTTNNLASISAGITATAKPGDVKAVKAYQAAIGAGSESEAAYWFYNLNVETVSGKTVVTINLPEGARFAGTDPLEVKSQDGSDSKELVKDVTVNVAVRNVKDADGKRSIDTAVFPMLINDSERPELVGGSYNKLISEERVTSVSFDPKKSTTIEVERVVDSLDAAELTNEITIVFDEPVKEDTDEFKVNVNNVTKDGAVTFNTAASYAGASTITLDLEKALEDYEVDNKVHNIKISAVKDLAGNITVPSIVEFNVKLVQPANFGQEKPVVEGIEQIGDNVFRIEWNRNDAVGKLNVLRTDGPDVKDVTIGKSELDQDTGKYYSVVYLPATDDKDEPADDANLQFAGQNFINRTFKITDMNVEDVETGTTPNTGKVFEKSLQVYKDIDAPVLDELIIQGDPVNYDGLKESGKAKLEVIIKDVTPFGANAKTDYDLLVMNADGDDKAAADLTDTANIRVLYEKDDIVRSVEVEGAHEALSFGQSSRTSSTNEDALTIDLEVKDGGELRYKDILTKEGYLVEGATYKVEIPEGFFADPALKPGTDTVQGFVASDREDEYGFTSLAITSSVTVPGEGDKEINNAVPQTAKSLIDAKFQSSVNRDEVEVQFKGSIDAKTLKNPSNYTLNGKTLAEWGVKSSDITYVVDGQDIDDVNTMKYARFYAPRGSVSVDGYVEITVEGVANKDGAKMTPVTTTIELKDNTAPEVTDSKLDGAKKIVLTFDEAVEAVSGAKDNFVVKVDGQIIAVESVTHEGNTVTLVLSQNVPSANAKIEIEVVEDNNGNIFVTDTSEAANKLVKGTKINVQ